MASLQAGVRPFRVLCIFEQKPNNLNLQIRSEAQGDFQAFKDWVLPVLPEHTGTNSPPDR